LETELLAVQSREANLQSDTARLQNMMAEAETSARESYVEICRLQANVQTLEELQLETELLKSHATDMSLLVAELKASLNNARSDVLKEQERRADAEEMLISANTDLKAQELQNAEIAGKLIVATSTMAQREEELQQLWNRLLESQKAAIVAGSNASQERERREAAEIRVAEIDQELQNLQSKLNEIRGAHTTTSDNMASEVALLTRFLREQNAASLAAHDARDAAEQKIANHQREIEQLSNKLKQQEPLLHASETARIAAERKLESRFDEIARLTVMLTETASKTSESEINTTWLRELLRVSQGFPKWWGLMPKQWRLKKEHARYLRKSLFDAEQYLVNNPDVAQFGIDPVLHYILHGMNEGRTWRN
jgi:hypothetical protein